MALNTPSHVRFIWPDGRGLTYASGVPWGDHVIANAHANLAPGQVLVSEGETREVAAVSKIRVPGLSASNNEGDVVLLRLDSPFSDKVVRATLADKPAGPLLIRHKDGVWTPRTRAARPDGQPDSSSPKWLILTAAPGARTAVPGDSGGAIVSKKTGLLVGVLSRMAAGQGPNLTHTDSRAALDAAVAALTTAVWMLSWFTFAMP